MKLTKGYKWDQEIEEEAAVTWKKILSSLVQLDVSFPRSICPIEEDVKSIYLVGFADASIKAYAAVLYVRYEDSKGEFHSRILASKNKVSPENKISVPRMELLSALLLSRLTKNTIGALTNIKIAKVYQLVDSSSTIGMLNKKSEALQEYCGVRVGEIKRNT